MAIEKITAKQYAKKRKIGVAAVYKAMILGHRLPGVVYRERFGNTHVFHFNENKMKKDLEVTK